MTKLFSLFLTLLFLSGCAGLGGQGSSSKKSTPSKASTPANQASAIEQTDEDDLWQALRSGFKLPPLETKRVAYYEHRFSRHPQHFYAMLERAKWFLPYILSEIQARDFPTELALIPAVESNFITSATSPSNAAGLWQFIGSTGKLYNLKQDWWFDGRRDPYYSTQAALTFFGELEKRFDGNWFHAIAAYNAGGQTIKRAIAKRAKYGKSTHFNHLKLRKETKDYVPKLIAFRNIFSNPEKYGLTLPKLSTQPALARVNKGTQIDIMAFAQASQIDLSTLQFLNSAYRRNTTPPSGPHHLYVPIDKLAFAQQQLADLPKVKRTKPDNANWVTYRVKRGDVLGSIAKKHRVSVSTIKQSNQLSSNLIHPGKLLNIPALDSAAISRSKSLTYKIRRGDTLWHIAKRYGVKVTQLSKWNKISQSKTLQPGEKLMIYTKS